MARDQCAIAETELPDSDIIDVFKSVDEDGSGGVPQINIPAWVFYMSWCADFELRVTQRYRRKSSRSGCSRRMSA